MFLHPTGVGPSDVGSRPDVENRKIVRENVLNNTHFVRTKVCVCGHCFNHFVSNVLTYLGNVSDILTFETTKFPKTIITMLDYSCFRVRVQKYFETFEALGRLRIPSSNRSI